ncbi:MAG TPA: IclR family transcriptional regulator [Candidatus Dormibacteraeota bacterium]
MREHARVVEAAEPSYLGRLLDLVSLIGDEPGLTITEAGQRTGMPVSTASRLVSLLVTRGFVRRRGTDHALEPGPRLERLALRSLQRMGHHGRFRDRVERLAELTGESVSLSLVEFDHIVLVSRRESEHALRIVARVGDLISPTTSATGKAILAFMSEDRANDILSDRDRMPPAAWSALEEELAGVRRCGHARHEEEFAVGQRCVAAPFFSSSGEPVGAISVAGPAARFTREAADAAVRQLLIETRSISAELGFETEPSDVKRSLP